MSAVPPKLLIKINLFKTIKILINSPTTDAGHIVPPYFTHLTADSDGRLVRVTFNRAYAGLSPCPRSL